MVIRRLPRQRQRIRSSDDAQERSRLDRADRAVALLAGCASTSRNPVPAPDAAARACRSISRRLPGADANAQARERRGRHGTGEGVARTRRRAQLQNRTIYFDFDSSEIKPEYNDLIAAHARYLAANASIRVRLEGNTDERGSREYNIGLGERRAQAVRRALMLQGVAESQITTVSYGEERPAVTGHTEDAWAQEPARRDRLSELRSHGSASGVRLARQWLAAASACGGIAARRLRDHTRRSPIRRRSSSTISMSGSAGSSVWSATRACSSSRSASMCSRRSCASCAVRSRSCRTATSAAQAAARPVCAIWTGGLTALEAAAKADGPASAATWRVRRAGRRPAGAAARGQRSGRL